MWVTHDVFPKWEDTFVSFIMHGPTYVRGIPGWAVLSDGLALCLKKRKLCLVISLCTLALGQKLIRWKALSFCTETTSVCHRRDILCRNMQVSISRVITICFRIFLYGQQNGGVCSKMLFVSVTVMASVPLRPTVPRLK